MTWMPQSFLNLEGYGLIEANHRERQDTYKDVLVNFTRYQRTLEKDWNGLFHMSKNNCLFDLMIRRSTVRVRKNSTFFPLFDRDLWTQAFSVDDDYLVALIRLARALPDQILTDKTAPSGRMTQAFLDKLNAQKRVYAEIKNSRLAIEWPKTAGMVGSNRQSEPFCNYLIDVIQSARELFY